jgi:hypothetical protein
MEETRNAYKILVRRLEKKTKAYIGRIILKWMGD